MNTIVVINTRVAINTTAASNASLTINTAVTINTMVANKHNSGDIYNSGNNLVVATNTLIIGCLFVQAYINSQGRIYIGASGSKAPSPELPEGPFENSRKSGKFILSNLREPQARIELKDTDPDRSLVASCVGTKNR